MSEVSGTEIKRIQTHTTEEGREFVVLNLSSDKSWLGFIIYSTKGIHGTVHEIEVKQQFKGYGSLLTKEAKKQMIEKGVKFMTVGGTTPASREIWVKMGLSEVKREQEGK